LNRAASSISHATSMSFPETNPSLILRLHNFADERAWLEFVDLYRPVIVRLARQKGLQPNDAEDIAQNVLASVAAAISRWNPDSQRAKFRTWLYTIANRQVIDMLRRRRLLAATNGGSLDQKPIDYEARREDSRLLRMELRRQFFHRVAASLRNEFSEAAWMSFWLMAVDGLSAEVVAERTGKTVGAVYAAKARVAKRLLERVRVAEQEFPEESLEA
jgi:RNA polymerase sigma-70 factor (ECF subfamily)